MGFVLIWLFSSRAFHGERTVGINTLPGPAQGCHFRAIEVPGSWMSLNLKLLQDVNCLVEGKRHLLFCQAASPDLRNKRSNNNTTYSNTSWDSLCMCCVPGSELRALMFLLSLFLFTVTLLDGTVWVAAYPLDPMSCISSYRNGWV